MGLVAGLVAAPCTGPVLGAALAFVATRGSVAFGVAVMFAYALGIGLLFFLLGAFSFSLPKSGPWMDAVKSLFGVALLVMALAYLKDLFPAARALVSGTRAAALFAAGAGAAGILMGALSGAGRSAAQRLARVAGVALLTLGTFHAVSAGGVRTASAAGGIDWIVNQERAALDRARAEGRPVIIDFWGDWCAACRELDHTAWSDPRVQAEARRFVALKLDNSTDKMADPKAAEAIDAVFEKYGIVGQPTVVFIDAHGRELPAAARVTGVVSADEMLRHLRAVDGACQPAAVACLARW